MAVNAVGSVNFLSLAYLLEFSLVLNLTFRELKFPELHKELKEKVESINFKYTKQVMSQEMDDKTKSLYPEVMKLDYLVKPEDVGECNRNDKNPWVGHLFKKIFFRFCIKKRFGLLAVNLHILASLALLLACTLFSNEYYMQPIAANFKPILPWASRQVVWTLLLVFSIYLCFTPLLFIRLGTLCEEFFYGKDGKSGIVNQLESEMNERSAFWGDINSLEELNKDAGEFRAPKRDDENSSRL